MIGFVKFTSEPSEHFPDGEIVFVMSVETCWIKDHRSVGHLSHVAAPEVTVKEGGEHVNVGEEGRHPGLQS